ncbi:hypothetical protein G7Y79_00026g059590 [Physcia stellaris]|nr:hypothetical protein G7Y79_00026g059590 [Physcia stellaris]
MFTCNWNISAVLWTLLLIASSVHSRSILHPESLIFPLHNTSTNASLSLNNTIPHYLNSPAPTPNRVNKKGKKENKTRTDIPHSNFPDPYDLRIYVPNPRGMMLELYGYTSHVPSWNTWRACRGAAFHARSHPSNAPMDTQDSYVYTFRGVDLFLFPDFDAQGNTKLTWDMWGTAAYGLGTFAGVQHFDRQFQFMVLQDWPPGQQQTQRYLGKGAVISNRGVRVKGGEPAGVTA